MKLDGWQGEHKSKTSGLPVPHSSEEIHGGKQGKYASKILAYPGALRNFGYFFYIYFIQHCFICRPDSTESMLGSNPVPCDFGIGSQTL
jgi:hypothetical protein